MQAIRPAGESERSRAAWDADLRQLLRDAGSLFADVVWHEEDNGSTIYAHKFILYARAFQQTFLGVPHSLSDTNLSRIARSSASLRTFTPTSAVAAGPAVLSLRPEDHTSASADAETVNTTSQAGPARLALRSADVPVFRAALERFYTAAEEDEAFRTVLDGFQDGTLADHKGATGVERLREDLLYSWRSKLYADVSLVLDGAPGGPFAAHRAMLAVRSPYFRSLLLGRYSDSSAQTFTLPSPPFTPASTTFVLGYIYSGTLDFSTRNFDLTTAFELWRCAAFLNLSALQDELEERIGSTLTVQRAARVFAFAHAPDVGSNRLASAAMPFLVERLDPTWVATPHISEVDYEAQKKLVRAACDNINPDNAAAVAVQVAACRRKLAASSWAEHVLAMLEAVEAELVEILANNLGKVVCSASFNDLVDGVGFNSDVLEWLLGLLVKGLTEMHAAQAYQVLVEKVLRREQGLRADARVLVEDTRVGVLRYLKRKWAGVRQCGGFKGIAPYLLEELASELNVSVDDLAAAAAAKHLPARTHATHARQAPLHLLEGRPSPFASAPSAAPAEKVALRPSQRASLPKRDAGVGATSTARRRDTTVSRSSTTRSSAGHTSNRASATTVSSATNDIAATPPRPLPPLSSTTRALEGSRPSVEAGLAGRPAPSRSGHASHPASRMPRRLQTGPQRSEAPPSAGAVPSRMPLASTVAAPSAPATSRNAPARDARQDLSSARLNAHGPLRVLPRSDRQRSASTATSRTLSRPPSATSLRSTKSIQPSTPPAAARSRVGSQPSSTLRPSASRSRYNADQPTRSNGTGVSRASLSPVALHVRSTEAGTALLAPIPCIVTVRCDRLFRIRAQVRYIGPLDGQQGEWVGVEAATAVIPEETRTLPWGDGSRDGVTYFEVSADDAPARRCAQAVRNGAAVDSPALRDAPQPSTSMAASDPSDSVIRPVSRRARRSASNERSAAVAGTRKALFVRPSQIVYVL